MFTSKAVAGYAAESSQPKQQQIAGKTRVSPDEPLAIIGSACAFPGKTRKNNTGESV